MLCPDFYIRNRDAEVASQLFQMLGQHFASVIKGIKHDGP